MRCRFALFIVSDGTTSRHTISIPIIGDDIVFTGVGDLFAAVFLAHSTTKSNLAEALEYTVATLQAVLRNTLTTIPIGMICMQFYTLNTVAYCYWFRPILSTTGKKPTAQQRELKLIQSKSDIENPTVSIRAKKLQ